MKAEALHSSSIMATWEISPNNCDVFGYRVHYYEVNNPDEKGKAMSFKSIIIYTYQNDFIDSKEI